MWKESVDYLTIDILGLTGKINDVVNFFIYDTFKIWFLLITIIFIVSYLRTHFNTQKVRVYLLGTALSFMMAITALSLPEAMILKRILHIKLIALFSSIVGFGIVCIGYLFNFIL